MLELKESNEYRRVTIENIVFMQGDDYDIFRRDNPDLCPSIDTESTVQALLQWWYPDEHETVEHYARYINTAFLGDLIKVKGIKGYFLYSVDTGIGYVGLARIVGFPK